jgi:predicted permease
VTDVFVVILPLFLIILASAIIQRARRLGAQWSEVLNTLALHVGFPALIFSALTKHPFSITEQLPLIAINSVCIIIVFALAFLSGTLLRIPARILRPAVFCLGFGNVAYLGIPILLRVFGEPVLTTGSLIVAVYLFWTFTLGVGFLEFTRHEHARPEAGRILSRLIRNPLLLSVAAGIIVSQSGILLPGVISQTLEMLAASVTPLVLILLGLFVGKADPGTLRSWRPVFLFSIVKLCVIPVLFYLLIRWWGGDPHLHAPSIIESAMPVAITPFALAQSYDLDADFIARSIILSTLCSIVTLPFWITIS